jgi:hypothetical protein
MSEDANSFFDYREQLKNPASLRYIDKLVLSIYDQPAEFPAFFQLLFDKDKNIAWRAAWACQKISEKHPEWFTSAHFFDLSTLVVRTSHGGLQRGCLSVLNNIPLPDPLPVDLINACFNWMSSAKAPIAVQALSMKLLANICKKEPDFTPELIAYLENIDYERCSAGFRSTRKNVLKALGAQ